VLAAVSVIGLLDGYLPAYTDRISFWAVGDVIGGFCPSEGFGICIMRVDEGVD
jgi:hypothetical protein